MKIKIISFDIGSGDFNCLDEDNQKHLVDVLVDGGIDMTYEEAKTKLTGRTIECEYLFPYLEIASCVKLIEE